MKIFFLFILTAVLIIPSGVSQERPRKKIVEFSHVTSVEDVLYPGIVWKHIKDMERRPFDGLILRLREYNNICDIRPWQKADLKPQIDTLATIQWGKFTDNFLFLYATNKWDMDWFNDYHWKTIAKNMKLTSEAAKEGKFVGICFDWEPYGVSPWQYPGTNDKYATRSFAEVAAKARQRGIQFIKALQTDMPKMKLLGFFQMALFEQIFDIIDKQEREKKLYSNSKSYISHKVTFYTPWHTNFSLAYPFFLGMLEGAGPGVTFIDGNEGAYTYENPEQFYRAYHTIKNRALGMIPEELRAKYQTQVQVGSTIYLNQMFGGYKGSAINFSHEERLRYFEHNLYYALQTSDEYVWFYSDSPIRWWYDFLSGKRGERLPDGTEAAMYSAKQKYEQGRPLGFDMIKEIAAAKEKAKTINSQN
ncbi:MAG: hypothetical protein M0Q53_09905 [Prolixibacteraceae bacterium]|nr:hypothetical protein [Prolixibacteraceae bacterium]